MPGPLPFRRRIFLILVAMTAVPTVLAVTGWVLTVRSLVPAAGARASAERVAASARTLLEGVDTLHLTADERTLLRLHLAQVSNAVSLTRRAETFLRYYTASFAALILLLGAAVIYAAVNLAGHLSRQLSRPIDELVGWTQLIRRRERLPPPGGPPPPTRGAPEFEALRQALRELADALAAARERELEAERLRAFREVARRVAHEIKNPLTSMRIAVDQLERAAERTAGQPDGTTAMALQVLGAETDRLERLAKEFSEFGRMPDGPQSEVDLIELLEEMGRTSVPRSVAVRLTANGGRRTLLGHYEPLRRAFANLLRNASEAMGGTGAIDISVAGEGAGLAVTIADHGPGISPDLRPRIFEPYFTTKADGTGLGLALVRATLEAHRGTITVSETPGGGATFSIVFPPPTSTNLHQPPPTSR
ncbi:MAG: sensor histidine kinase [Gemmatimonadales bacterium]